MTMKPPKKSDMGKSWMRSRHDKKIIIQPERHLIVTEGTKTEPAYFKAIKDIINEKFSDKIHLDIQGEGRNTVSLFERAVKSAGDNPNGYKHVWVVYDTDDFAKDKIDIVPQLCKTRSNPDCQYHAIWSNQCIELWYLLHFSFMQSDIHRDEYYPKLTTQLNNLGKGDYSKNREDMFNLLLPYLSNAIANAKALNEINKKKSPSQSAPGTKVYEFIEKIKAYI